MSFGRKGNAGAGAGAGSATLPYPLRARRQQERRREDRRHIEIPVAVERRRGGDRRGDTAPSPTADATVAQPAQVEMPPPPVVVIEGRVRVHSPPRRYALEPELAREGESLHERVVQVLDFGVLLRMDEEARRREVVETIEAVLAQEPVPVPLTAAEQRRLTEALVNDLIGWGPLEPLLADPAVTDIMVNGPDNVWIERQGRMMRTDVTFNSSRHLMNVIQRIVGRANRRVDELSPMVDCRLPDGSRVNAVVPPLAVRAPSLSIRKFADRAYAVDDLLAMGSMSPDMAMLLKMAARYRLNVLISGGTGTGKTTLLRAMAQHFAPAERVVTIEDTAELHLALPNLVELESRPPNIEGAGEVTLRDLLKNALRMRPDRIIVGEVRGAEAGEMLQAMNTGHEGSLGTIHANTAPDALMRFHNMICMNDKYRPGPGTLRQIVNALDLVVHISRMRDGSRRITYIGEVVSLEGETIVLQDLIHFAFVEEREDGSIIGRFEPSLLPPHFTEKLRFFSLDSDERAFLRRITPAS